MPDIATIGAVLSSVKTATEIAKLIKDGGDSLEKAELKLQLAELISSLADAKIELSDIQEVIADKEREISELKLAFELKENMVRNRDAYYLVNDSGSPEGDPYCMACWDLKQKAYPLHTSSKSRHEKVCPSCKTGYQTMMTKKLVPSAENA